MPESIFFIGILICTALIFDFINGFHDTANAVATSIATGALAPFQAVILASILNFTGALLFTGVAHTIAEGIISPSALSNGLQIVFSALLSGTTWNMLTWYFGIPSSSSHALIGSLAGATTAAAGWKAVNDEGLLCIIQALVISPPLALAAGFAVMILCRLLLKLNSKKIDQHFRKMQVMAAAFQAFSHGSNDAQKTMGVITFALVAGGIQHDLNVIPLWVKISAALAMAAGTSVGGWRIIQTVSKKITRLTPPSGFSADLASAAVITTATLLHLPVSTTHVISSSITGVGCSTGLKNVNWQTVYSILAAWLTTIPISFILGVIFYRLLSIIKYI
ncbi:MAG: inorganic phosphate transporter [Desulfotomaculum sp.]|nr:inorganic phosphate transporter [Desulfotomaculum sp.]